MPRTASEWDATPRLPDDCYVDTRIYTDPEIYAEEQEKILRKTWKFVCHDSEVPEIGDYRTHEWTGIPMVTVRGTDGEIRTFVNSCSHRGAKVVRMPAGNMKHMTCFFHLWEYDLSGNCTYQSRDEAYEAHGPTKDQAGLREVRTDIFCGLVFVNYDGNAMTLREYIGSTADAFEEVFTENDLEVFHYNQSHVKGNWKSWYLTNCDLYHEWGHLVNRTTSVLAPGYHDRPWHINPEGHGYCGPLADGNPFIVQYKNYRSWDSRDELVLKGAAANEFRIIDIFPNTTIILRSTCIRINHSTPYAPNHSILEERGLGIKDESATNRRRRSKEFIQIWGPLSRNLHEDAAFVEAQQVCQEHGANKFDLMSRLEILDGDLERAHSDAYLRLFYGKWSEYMGRPAHNPMNEVASAAE